MVRGLGALWGPGRCVRDIRGVNRRGVSLLRLRVVKITKTKSAKTPLRKHRVNSAARASALAVASCQMVVPSEEATHGEPPSLINIPSDVLQKLEGSLGLREAQALEAAAAWCVANKPRSLADIQVEPQLSEFVAALNLAKIPAKKLRDKLVVTGYAAKYDSIRLIGRGGFGETYLVRDKGNNQQFASKHISRPTPTETDEALKEFNVMKKLRHPMLVEAFESFREPSAKGEFTVRNTLLNAYDSTGPSHHRHALMLRADHGHDRDGVLRRPRPAGVPEGAAGGGRA